MPANMDSIRSIVVIGDYEDPLYHWFLSRLTHGANQNHYAVSSWCLDDPAFLDTDLSAPAADLIINTTLEKSAFTLSAYLASAKMEGHQQPSIIFQNVLCQTLFEVQASSLKDCEQSNYDWLGFSAFSLYGHLDKTPPPALELCQIEANSMAEHQAFLESFNIPSTQSPACPGLVLGRIVSMLVNEACFALMENVATADAIDTAMTLGTNYPMGPLAWADKAGLDVILAILNHLFAVYKEPRYRPARLLQERVSLGLLGQKTGQGFYAYPEPAVI
ncbi:MAG: 3-hydroxyacyl-CoA dehydrogenase family protein [Vampirovibrionales bacterium]|nr:3-hydroxyacyl-CoA dehydrogenase family protein [Vampirovibrionales bacterium]